MAKTNFTKVEESLAEGMRKMEVDRLLIIADKTSGVTNKSSIEDLSKIHSIHQKRLNHLFQELCALEAAKKDPYGRLNIDKLDIKKFIDNPTTLTAQDWQTVKEYKDKVANFKAELEKKPLKTSDDDLVNIQRKSQKTKRFNINEKWIPLK